MIPGIATGISAAALSLSLALAPAAFAQDSMQQDVDFKNSLSRDDGVKKDTMPKAATKKGYATKKAGLSK
jgi:pentapeptide MXKDX repeat protein